MSCKNIDKYLYSAYKIPNMHELKRVVKALKSDLDKVINKSISDEVIQKAPCSVFIIK